MQQTRKVMIIGCLFPGIVIAILGAISVVGALLGHTPYVFGAIVVVLIGAAVAAPAVLTLLILFVIDATTRPPEFAPNTPDLAANRLPRTGPIDSAQRASPTDSSWGRFGVIFCAVVAGVCLVFAVLELLPGHWIPGVPLAILGCFFTGLVLAVSRLTTIGR